MDQNYVDERSLAHVVVTVRSDEVLAGDEAKILAWQLDYLFPQLDMEYSKTSRQFTEDYNKYYEAVWVSNKPIDINESSYFSFVKRDDGTFAFEATIPQILDSVSTDKAKVTVLEFAVVMPKTIEIANTPIVDDKRAVWNITYQTLASGTKLKAYTE